jgi:hypothetical protein
LVRLTPDLGTTDIVPESGAGAGRLISAAAAPTATSPDAEEFYAASLRELAGTEIPFLVAGTYAVSAYTGVSRPTKDLDVFCKAGDYPRILGHFKQLGFAVKVNDDRWLAAISKGDHYFDVIFACSHGSLPVDEHWFENAERMELFGTVVQIIGPTELVWSKVFVQHRLRYDGADVAHLILKQHDKINWRRLLDYMELHWEVLLMHLLNFRWIYPSERHLVPAWLLDELIDRVHNQLGLPASETKICRGRLFSPGDYEIDVREWGFADV